jgi:4'-phosphopantetheinyl transferase
MGATLARVWARHGHQVAITSTRSPASMERLVVPLGPGVEAALNADAIRRSEIVVLAVPWHARTEVAGRAGALSGKIVLDAMNAYDPYPHVVDLGETGSSEVVAGEFAGARVVKGLNAVQASRLGALAQPRGSPRRVAVPLFGDDLDARHAVAELIDAAGFDPLDLGLLCHGRWAEPDAPLFGRDCAADQLLSLFRRCIESSGRNSLRPEEVCVWSFQLCSEPHLIARAEETLSREERERASQFRDGSLRDRAVLSRGLLRMLLAGYCGSPPESLEFACGPQGKPSLAGCASPVDFNVSHSGEIAAYAFTTGCAVGIDVERHRDLPDMEGIAGRYFSRAEFRELMDVPESDREAAFYDCWVRKEAFVKARGGGLSIPLDSFQVSVAPGRPASLLKIAGNDAETRQWSIQEFWSAPGYSGAVAWRNRWAVQIHALRSAREILEPPPLLRRRTVSHDAG